MKKTLVVLFLFLGLFILGLALFFIWNQKSLQIRLWLWGVSLDTNKFKLTDFVREKDKTLQKDTLEAQNKEISIKVIKTVIVNHQKFIDDRIYLLQSLFEPTTSPYPEVLTNVLECPLEFRPKKESFESGTIFQLYAGERFSFGVCSNDLVEYKSIYGIFDCGKKGVFEISLFGKKWEDLQPIVKSFSCQNG